MKRNIGIDLLRILLALMVIAIHFNARGTGRVAVEASEAPLVYVVNLMVALCYPAVNTYVLITGYYSNKLEKNYSRILISLIKLWICLIFFQIVGYLLVTIFNKDTFSVLSLLKRFFPLSRGVWWFMTNYFLLMLISPVLNNFINKSSKKNNCLVLTMLLVVCSFIPFFIQWDDVIGLNNGYGIIWFVVLYYTGALLFKYCKYTNDNLCYKYFWIGLLAFVILSFILLLSGSWLGRSALFTGYTFHMYNSILVYTQSITLFVAFWNIRIDSKMASNVIVKLAGLSLAAYIFHCQEDIAGYLWKYVNPSYYANDLYLIPLFIYTVLGVYFLSIVIESLRRFLMSCGNFENRIIGWGVRIIDVYIK